MKLKNYKNLVPLVLIILMVLSCYSLITAAQSKETEYLGYLAAAREKREQGVITDALKNYQSAIALKPDIDTYMEVGEMLAESGDTRSMAVWGQKVLDKYPRQPEGYEYLIDVYLRDKKYDQCFAFYDVAVKRQLATERMEAAIDSIAYIYEIDYRSYDEISVFGGGYCAVKRDDYWGYVNQWGTPVIGHLFEEAGVFAGETAPVKDPNGDFYYIDANGDKKIAVPEGKNMQKLGILDDDIYLVSEEGEYFYYHTAGELLFGPFEYASTFNYGQAAVQNDGEWYFIDMDGNRVNQDSYSGVALDEKEIAFRNGRAFVKISEGYVMIAETGEKITEAMYEDARPFYGAAYAAVKQNGKWGFVDAEGNLVMDAQYEDARSFSNGLAAVRFSSLWGFIDMEGNMVIEPLFEEAGNFTENGGVFIKQNGQWKYLQLIRYDR